MVINSEQLVPLVATKKCGDHLTGYDNGLSTYHQGMFWMIFKKGFRPVIQIEQVEPNQTKGGLRKRNTAHLL